MGGILSDVAESMSDSIAKQMEYELRAAWMAGYDYVHVYDGIHCAGARIDAFSIKQYILTTNVREPPRPGGAVYRYTYDIGSVPDEVVKEQLGLE